MEPKYKIRYTNYSVTTETLKLLKKTMPGQKRIIASGLALFGNFDRLMKWHFDLRKTIYCIKAVDSFQVLLFQK